MRNGLFFIFSQKIQQIKKKIQLLFYLTACDALCSYIIHAAALNFCMVALLDTYIHTCEYDTESNN